MIACFYTCDYVLVHGKFRNTALPLFVILAIYQMSTLFLSWCLRREQTTFCCSSGAVVIPDVDIPDDFFVAMIRPRCGLMLRGGGYPKYSVRAQIRIAGNDT